MLNRLQWVAVIIGSGLVLDIAPVGAEPNATTTMPPVLQVRDLPRLFEASRSESSVTVKHWLSQQPAEVALPIRVIDVKLNPTQQGLEVILQTETGQALQATRREEGNSLVVTVANAVLALSNGQAFEAEKPAEGIDRVTVTQADATTIQVSIAGVSELPIAQIVPGQGLVLAVTPEAAGEEEEITVTGEQDGYRVPNSSALTRTNTPLRDIPQSIQVIPQEVLRDQRADVPTALRNAPSVRNAAPSGFDSPRILVRGFFSSPALDGLVSRIFNGAGANFGPDLTGIERIEVLQGPNSVLFGSLSPGGTINYVTKRPLSEPYYFAEVNLGSFSFYRGEVDLSGPLDSDKRLLYRLNASYRDQGSFLDSNRTRNFVVAPVITAKLGENTDFSVEAVYKNLFIDRVPMGLPAVGTVLSNPNGKIRRSLNVNEGSLNLSQVRVTSNLNHRFSENWSLNTTFRYDGTDIEGFAILPGALRGDNRTLPRFFSDNASQYREYKLSTNVVGKFSTGSIRHELLFGVDLARNSFIATPAGNRTVPSIDVFNPIFGQSLGPLTPTPGTDITNNELGILVQDRITLADNLKLLVSGRFDTFSQSGDFDSPTASQSGNAFSPRVGIVYQPIQPISLYASFSRSFEPNIGLSFARDPFQPSRGTQYEVGVKADLNSRLSTTLALYDITRSNVLTADPVNADFSVQTGEQRSRGVELSLAGEILPGWKVFAGYAYNDSRITQSNVAAEVGKRFQRTGPHAASLWTTYEMQKGDLQGLGFGLGLFYVSDRAGDNANTFELPSYLTTDAAIFYKKDRFRAAINVRNLFDVDYFEGSFNRNRVFYGAPFTVEGTISWTF
ncbi:TonB-dependent siderophore receptor [Myxacorys almedinensis]|uniref:TonB-dependent siderophore receptor n=1 Tax=Myxacorys almedinensis A TaxID=2690445 RepID=A0A8J7Z048_9CYAN|nr:TonB-dependent siderophore receptor [Myxacorys almedinensis]NDJ17707.1 TonB-dependent siderophore receptor [Myxacorys almedinensis A]